MNEDHSNVHVVILAGGSGLRLWPLSHEKKTKPFLCLPYNETLIAQAFYRACRITSAENVWVVTVHSQVEQVKTCLPLIQSANILVEPQGKNTAAAACFATMYIASKSKAPVTLLILPADHYIPEVEMFVGSMQHGIEHASLGESLVTFGLTIQAPRVDFGYIEVETGKEGKSIYRAKRFIEKPPLEKAEKYFQAKTFYWNSGMFSWRSDLFFSEMEKHSNSIYNVLSKLNWKSSDVMQKLENCYSQVDSISIDYALMEKSTYVDVIPVKFQWSDLGTWNAVADSIANSTAENVVVGQGTVVEGKNNFVRSYEKPIVLFGMNDMVIVDTKEVTLITNKEKSKDLKRLLEILGRA